MFVCVWEGGRGDMRWMGCVWESGGAGWRGVVVDGVCVREQRRGMGGFDMINVSSGQEGKLVPHILHKDPICSGHFLAITLGKAEGICAKFWCCIKKPITVGSDPSTPWWYHHGSFRTSTPTPLHHFLNILKF